MSRAAIVVVGGAGRRLGGVAKPWLPVAGRPIVDHVIDAALGVGDLTIVVGDAPSSWRPPRGVVQTIEEPRGSGPAAAIRAGLALVPATVDSVLLLAGDAPFVDAVLPALVAGSSTGDGAAVMSAGRVQYLCACLDRRALERALDAAGDSMRSVFDHLRIHTIEADLLDADTWEDVATLRAMGAAMSENRWLDEATEILGVQPVIDIDAVLALARDVAHNQERKNAPLTAYVLGYAAAAKGLSAAEVAEFATKLGAHAIENGNNA